MTLAIVAFLLAEIARPDVAEELPTRLTFDESRQFRLARRSQEQDPRPERPADLPGARPREPVQPGLWAFSAAPTLIFMGGKTRVREWESAPARLNLSGDLGMGATPGIRVGLSYETRALRGFLEMDLARSDGRGRFDRNFAYDEARFVGGVPYETHADLYFGRAGVVLPGAIWERRNGRISPFVGLEYVRLSVGIDQPSTGQGTAEQYEQFVPYPIAGVTFDLNLADGVTFSGRVYGGMMPNVGTPFTEGGRLFMKVETAGVDVELSWQATSSLRLFAGIGYLYWNGRLRSAEDGNEFMMSAPMVRLGVEVGW